MSLALRLPPTQEGSVKSFGADISRGKKTDVSMESMPPPKRTGTVTDTEKGAEIRAETEEVKEVIAQITLIT